ncbi:hypothetical protein GCM10010452_55290 [Crossiella cryophila]
MDSNGAMTKAAEATIAIVRVIPTIEPTVSAASPKASPTLAAAIQFRHRRPTPVRPRAVQEYPNTANKAATS